MEASATHFSRRRPRLLLGNRGAVPARLIERFKTAPSLIARESVRDIFLSGRLAKSLAHRIERFKTDSLAHLDFLIIFSLWAASKEK